jgi:hypothetical protein
MGLRASLERHEENGKFICVVLLFFDNFNQFD